MRIKTIKNADKHKMMLDLHIFLMRADITVQHSATFHDEIDDHYKAIICYHE